MRKKFNNFTEGSILSAIVKLSLPVALTNLFQTIYNLIDAFWLGRYSRESVASISFSFPILFLLISLGAGLTVAGTILVAQFFGKGERERVNYISTQVFMLVVIISVFISVTGIILSPYILKLAGAKERVFVGGVNYLRICFTGIIFIFGFFVFQSLLRGIGVVNLPMFIVLGTVILNFFIDPLFIFGYKNIFPEMGVKGAAYATVFSQGLATLILFYVLIKGIYGIRIKKEYMKLDFLLLKDMFSLGLPPAIEHSTRAFSFSLLVFIVGHFGNLAVASYGIVTRIFGFIIIPAVGVAMAVTALVGQNMGAGKIKRAEKISIISGVITFFLMAVAGILFFIFSKNIMKLFTPEDFSVIKEGSQFIRITSLTFGFIGLQIVFGGTFRGSGNTKIAMFLTLFTFIILRITIAFILSFYTNLKSAGIFYAFGISNILGGVLATGLFLTGFWKKKKLTEEVKIKDELLKEEAEIPI